MCYGQEVKLRLTLLSIDTKKRSLDTDISDSQQTFWLNGCVSDHESQAARSKEGSFLIQPTGAAQQNLLGTLSSGASCAPSTENTKNVPTKVRAVVQSLQRQV